MIAEFLLAAALTGISSATAGPDTDGTAMRIENGRILRVSPRPGFGSGVFAVYADFDIAATGEQPREMYVLWMTQDQFLPVVGSVCTISYRSEPLLGGNLHDHSNRGGVRDDGPHNVVRDLDCGLVVGAMPSVQRGSPSAR